MKRIYLIILLSGIIILLIISGVFFYKAGSLDSELKANKQTMQQFKKEAERLRSENDNLLKEKEKLQSDAVLYLSLNNDLQQENDNMLDNLVELKKIIDGKEQELELQKKNLEKIDLNKVKNMSQKYNKLLQEKDEAQKKLKSLESALNDERAVYHYNLGVAYTQSNLYDRAIEAYEKSLSINSDNAEAHYNLGVLYEEFRLDPEKAIWHYEEYLRLKPEAEDREEVRGAIEKLSS